MDQEKNVKVFEDSMSFIRIVSLMYVYIYVYRITKYGNSERSSQEKTMHKPMAQHLNNTGKDIYYRIRIG